MCGICGILNMAGHPVSHDTVAHMNRAIGHRGPDGSGVLYDGEVGLGHRRLSIIDIDGGHQPIANEDQSTHVVFNGEIYNFVELRQELETLGHQFSTRSDTEVIVHAYEQWGTACVNHFNGMFAFALWDQRQRQLFLARDHLGIKPLYYVVIGSELVFGSEIKALLKHPLCPREINLESLGDLFTFRYVPSPKTLFDRIMKLPPGHCMTVSRDGMRIERFWTWSPVERSRCHEADVLEEYQNLLQDAVKLQLRSDVPLGLFLSSGVDSAMLLAIMSEHLQTPVQTFTIGFHGGERTNEVDDARQLAHGFGAAHAFEMLGPDDYKQHFERYMSDIEEPVGNETAAAFYFVSRLAARQVKVALTGQGADEPWAGYGRHLGAKLSGCYSRMPSLMTGSIESLVTQVPGRMERIKRGVSSLGEPDMLTRLAKIYSFFSADMKSSLFQGALKNRHEADPHGSRHALAHLQRNVAHLDPLTQMLYIDTRSNLPDDLLMVGDKTSMANSIELRVPFLDHRLVQFIESLPPSLKLKGLTGKYLHKRAAEKWLPAGLVHRRKKGFANPVEHWLRTSMRPFIDECLLSGDSGMRNYFDQAHIAKMLKQDRTGTAQLRRHIYLLVSLELWHRAFIRA
jgi:asparagine synthase (glutamine-hydrolysing)